MMQLMHKHEKWATSVTFCQKKVNHRIFTPHEMLLRIESQANSLKYLLHKAYLNVCKDQSFHNAPELSFTNEQSGPTKDSINTEPIVVLQT